jgi:hypothetical protein
MEIGIAIVDLDRFYGERRRAARLAAAAWIMLRLRNPSASARSRRCEPILGHSAGRP